MAAKVAVPAARAPRARPTDWSAYLYLAPVLVSTLLFIILPFLYTVYISFTNYSLFHFLEFQWAGLQNYKQNPFVVSNMWNVFEWYWDEPAS